MGGNGILTPQETFYTQGLNPFRLLVDSTGSYIFALEHDSIGADGVNASSPTNQNPNCALALGSIVTNGTCGDISIFSINQTTGRLSTILNTQVTQANCPGGATSCPLPYFPVPANPIDFLLSAGYMLTLDGTPATGDSIFPYAYSSGQLELSQNGPQPLTDPYSSSTSGPSAGLVTQATALVAAGGVYYVLDNEPISIIFDCPSGQTCSPTVSDSQILPYTLGTNGALQAAASGIIPDASTLANPTWLMVESKGKYVYVANQGNNTTDTNNPESGIAAYFITSSSNPLSFVSDQPFGSGSGPQCIVEDPSNQYIYEANFYDSTVTGRVLDPNSGELDNMRVNSTYTLKGPATWCLVDGRTG